MALAVKPGYKNPLTVMKQKNPRQVPTAITRQKDEKSRDVQDLQTKRQTIQNQILLMKDSTNGAAADTQEVLEEKLEEISAELRAAKSQEAQMAGAPAADGRFDSYVPSTEEEASSGLYQVRQDGDGIYEILFSPYEER